MRQYEYQPCIPTRGTEVPSGPDWFHELKHDGYRLIVQREGKRIRTISHAVSLCRVTKRSNAALLGRDIESTCCRGPGTPRRALDDEASSRINQQRRHSA
jgi:hypothetical protein